jgi:hypothetical protein
MEVVIVSPCDPRIINCAVIAGLDPLRVVRLRISLRSLLRASVIAARKFFA